MSNYESPITLMEQIQTHLAEDLENGVISAVRKYSINADKEELIKALEYNRGQYEQGFNDCMMVYEKALDKACMQLSCLCPSISKGGWKEWAIDEVTEND